MSEEKTAPGAGAQALPTGRVISEAELLSCIKVIRLCMELLDRMDERLSEIYTERTSIPTDPAIIVLA